MAQTAPRSSLSSGWSTLEIVAVDKDHRVLPLYRQPFSTVHPQYKSETHELRQVLQQVVPTLDSQVWAVLDRGFDGAREFALLDEFFSHGAVRQRGDRHVYLPGHGEPMGIDAWAKTLRLDPTASLRYMRDSQWVRAQVAFGYCTILVPKQASRGSSTRKPACEPRGLIVSRFKDSPFSSAMMLWVSRPIRSATLARRWLEAYRRRWGCEEQTRLGNGPN